MDANNEPAFPFCEGDDAYEAGLGTDANPYPRGTNDDSLWFAGWADAADRDPQRDH